MSVDESVKVEATDEQLHTVNFDIYDCEIRDRLLKLDATLSEEMKKFWFGDLWF